MKKGYKTFSVMDRFGFEFEGEKILSKVPESVPI